MQLKKIKIFCHRKQLVKSAQESRDDWPDEDSLFPKVSVKRNHNTKAQPLLTGLIL